MLDIMIVCCFVSIVDVAALTVVMLFYFCYIRNTNATQAQLSSVFYVLFCHCHRLRLIAAFAIYSVDFISHKL